jgi:ribulose-phosphate 3-epimerase
MQIIPAILTDSKELAQQQLDAIQALPQIKTVQIDVVDGIFADTVTITPLDLTELELGKLKVDLHLMTDEPLDYVYEAADIRPQLPIRAVVAQVERMSFQSDFLKAVHEQQWQAGLALDVFTPLDAIEDKSWQQLDLVVLLGVEAGEQNQVMHQSIFFKLEELRQKLEKIDREITMSVDGGIKMENIRALSEAGATELIVGSAIWAPDDIFDENQALAALKTELS